MAMQHSRISTAMHTDVKRGASAAIEAARRRALALTLPMMIRTYPDPMQTWPYMAPEMFSGPGLRAIAANRGTDVYALGTLLWELFTGLEPWRELLRGHSAVGDPSSARLTLVRAGKNLDMAALPADTPAAVTAIIRQCLALDRAKRPRMGRVRAVLEQAREEFIGGRFDVFLSHAWGKGDVRKPFTDAIFFALREHGLRVWLDSNEMGHDLRASMADGMSKSNVVLALLSPDYMRSKQCMFELRFAAGADSEAMVQVDLTRDRAEAARSEHSKAEALIVDATELASRETADAVAKTAKKQRSLTTATAADDEDLVEITTAALSAARGEERRVRTEGMQRTGAVRALADVARTALLAAEVEVKERVAAVRVTGARRLPLVCCIVEPGLYADWTPSEELKALAGISSHLCKYSQRSEARA